MIKIKVQLPMQVCFIKILGNSVIKSGTKCLSGSERREAENGILLNDSHAEVLVRRGFLHWFLHQSLLALDNRSPFLDRVGTEQFVLKPGARLHLYTSHPPCGDASIYNLETQDGEQNQGGERNQDGGEWAESIGETVPVPRGTREMDQVCLFQFFFNSQLAILLYSIHCTLYINIHLECFVIVYIYVYCSFNSAYCTSLITQRTQLAKSVDMSQGDPVNIQLISRPYYRVNLSIYS